MFLLWEKKKAYIWPEGSFRRCKGKRFLHAGYIGMDEAVLLGLGKYLKKTVEKDLFLSGSIYKRVLTIYQEAQRRAYSLERHASQPIQTADITESTTDAGALPGKSQEKEAWSGMLGLS